MEQIIQMTDSAANQIAELILEENNPNLKLRIFVQGGGCSGMQYGFEFAEEVAEDDFTIEKNNVQILVDSMSYQYLIGATIDYKESIMGSSFSIDNPNAQTSCGCGSSFSV
jgi:iron-sulfur cluster insertion protein